MASTARFTDAARTLPGKKTILVTILLLGVVDAVRAALLAGKQNPRGTSRTDPCRFPRNDRWNEGCTNAWKLWEEIVPLGFKGTYGIVSAYIRKSACHRNR
ncbi:hypothetical protein [Streptomyces sp. NPDC054765]